jgi:hypothetical protein
MLRESKELIIICCKKSLSPLFWDSIVEEFV